jgi:uncharacterized DUF497 family protein
MRIVWDEPKRLANKDKHDGIDLAEVTEISSTRQSCFQASSVVSPPLDCTMVT